MTFGKSTSITNENFQFLSAGGEMGALMRSKNWDANFVGNPVTWPQSLRTSLSILLNSKFPMFLFWGKDLICFYNDAYRPSLGNNGKHPGILGMKGEEAWPEIWNIIKPLIDQVLSGGEASWSEDQLIPIYRNGKIEDVYWTFSYSPVSDESGKPAGVFVVCNETTDKVNNTRQLTETNNQLEFAIEAAEMGTFDYNPLTNKFTANKRLKDWFGLQPAEEIELHHAINVIAENDRQLVSEAIQKALDYNSGGNYDIEYTIINPDTKKEIIVRAKGKASFNEDKIAYRLNGVLTDETMNVRALAEIQESEEKLNIVIEASELGIFDLDLKTDIVVCSQRFYEIFGYKEKNDLNHPDFLSHLNEEYLIKRKEAFERAFETGILYYESKITWNDGSTHWVEFKGKVFYDKAHMPYMLIGTARDITEEKQYQQDLEEREEKFRLLAEFMPQFIWTGDRYGKLTYFNQSVFTYSGLSHTKLENDFWAQIVHPDERAETQQRWMYSINEGEPFVFEHRFRRSDGEYRWQLSRAIPQKDTEGSIQMWVGSSTDIHEIKKQDEEKDFFISIASHELKTPVTSIKAYIQLLLMTDTTQKDPFLEKSLTNIDRQIVKLTNLISDMLDLSKIKSGSFYLHKENFNLNNQVMEVIEEIRHINPNYNITFSKAPETIVNGDKERVGQVITNFLTNAIKYSPMVFDIKVTSAIENHKVIISVEDFGIGINKNDQEKIFDRFYRVEGKNEKTFPGFGIGLFICHEIIKRHDGRIGVISEPGKGSIFYFSLPLHT